MQVRGEQVGAFRSRRVALVLYILLKANGAEVSRSHIAGQVWPESSEVQALANLRQSLVDLRKALGPEAPRLIAIDRRSVRFEIEGVVVDCLQFQAFEKSHKPERWSDAIALYQGALLPGLSEEYVYGERENLEQRYIRLSERMLDLAVAEGAWQDIATLCLRILQVDPAHERAACELIRERVYRGDTAGTIRAYQEVRGALRRLLGLPPGPGTTRTYEEALETLARNRESSSRAATADSIRVVQQTELEAEWSRCSEIERAVLRNLSMFADPFSIAEVELVCRSFGYPAGQLVSMLSGLATRGLLQFNLGSHHTPYSLVPEVADLARTELLTLGESERANIAFIECMATFAEAGYAAFSGSSQRLWLERFDCQQRSLKKAFQMAVELLDSPDFAYRFAASISGFFMLIEGSMSLWNEIQRTALMSGGSRLLRAYALNAAGFRAQTLAKIDQSSAYLEQALALATELQDPYLTALVQTNQAMVLVGKGQLTEARKLYRHTRKQFQDLKKEWWQTVVELNIADLEGRWGNAEGLEQELQKALKVFQELEDDLQISSTRIALSSIYLQRGQVDEARAHQSIAHSKLQRLPAKYKQVYSLIQLGEIELIAEDYATAEAYVLEAAKLAENYNLPHARVSARRIQVQSAIFRDDTSRAEALIMESLPEVEAMKLPFQTAVLIELLAHVRTRQGDPDTARRLLARGWQIRKAAEPDLPTYPRSILRVLHELRQRGHSTDFQDVEPFPI